MRQTLTGREERRNFRPQLLELEKRQAASETVGAVLGLPFRVESFMADVLAAPAADNVGPLADSDRLQETTASTSGAAPESARDGFSVGVADAAGAGQTLGAPGPGFADRAGAGTDGHRLGESSGGSLGWSPGWCLAGFDEPISPPVALRPASPLSAATGTVSDGGADAQTADRGLTAGAAPGAISDGTVSNAAASEPITLRMSQPPKATSSLAQNPQQALVHHADTEVIDIGRHGAGGRGGGGSQGGSQTRGGSSPSTPLVLESDQIYQSADLWWFGGVEDVTNYATTIELTVVPSGEWNALKWYIADGDNIVQFLGGGSLIVEEGPFTNYMTSTVSLTSIGSSMEWDDVAGSYKWDDVTIDVYGGDFGMEEQRNSSELESGGELIASTTLTVFQPHHMVYQGSDHEGLYDGFGNFGYNSVFHYTFEDQFNRTLPDNVQMAEWFSNTTWATGTNWMNYGWSLGFGLESPWDFQDHISFIGDGAEVPQSNLPFTPLGDEVVRSVQSYWCGSTTGVGPGILLDTHGVIWFQDHGEQFVL